MTKLFSMKSLAFAGAAAFALTLVAAPKADAEEVKLDKKNVSVSYEDGILTVNGLGEEATVVADGTGAYFGSGKDASKIKYAMAPDSTYDDENDIITYDISNLLGKKTVVGVAKDANGTGAYTIELAESPKLAAKDIKDELLSEGKIDAGKKYQYKVGTYGRWDDVAAGTNSNLVNDVKRAKLLGTTIYFRMATIDDKNGNVMTSPWSKEVKVKIKAKAKAPKVAIKTAKLTKAFQWNMNAKLEYRVVVGQNTSSWKTGGGKAEWKKLIEDAMNATVDDKKDTDLKDSGNTLKTNVKIDELIAGEAIAAPVTFQVRTAATTKKEASQITVVSLEQSKNSPDKDQIEVKVVNGKGKSAAASAAAISPKSVPSDYMAQYSLDGKAWKNLTKAITIEDNKLNSRKLYLRLVGDGKDKAKSSLLPSAVTTLEIPKDGTVNDDGTTPIIKIEKAYTSDSTKWTPTEQTDYTKYTATTENKEN